MTRLYLIRHGSTDALGRKIAGRAPGTPLNDQGRREAERLAERLAGVSFAGIISSPLERALETARPLAAAQDLSTEVAAELNEIDFGEWTGRSFAELEQEDLWQAFNRHRALTCPPGGELMLGAQLRATEYLLSLTAAKPDASLALFSHGDVIRAVVMYFLGMPLDFVHRFEIDPASVTIVDATRSSGRILCLNRLQ